MKPGYKTTEFWLSLASMLVGAVFASGLLGQTATPIDDQLLGIIATVLGALGYTVSRTLVKRTDSIAASSAIVSSIAAPINPPKP